MIAAHNTFTFMEPTNRFYKLFKFIWKCQDKKLYELHKYGVRYFDIRIFRNKDNVWQVCYGWINFDKYFDSLEEICTYMKFTFPDVKYRIILEKGDIDVFIEECDVLPPYDNLDFICIKKDWDVLFDRMSPSIDLCAHTWDNSKSFFTNIKNFLSIRSIKSWTKRNNPQINMEMVNSDTIYFMDYV